ncbi:MAG: hypothetical protein PHG00_14805 [Methylococcales bacterium]|nr:hypothetical protein [Methylococcales bacterium]
MANIREAGFNVKINQTGFEISPASRLTQQQRDFLKNHREEIIAELNAEQDRKRFLHWRIISKGKAQVLKITPPHTLDEMQHVYRGADVIEPLAESPLGLKAG